MPVAELQAFRAKYPDYGDMSDSALADALASKYPEYADLPGKVKAGEKSSMADDLKSFGKTAARVGLGVGGALAGGVAGTVLGGPVGGLAGGALGSGAAETLSEWLFDDKLSPKQIALQTALGALPGMKFAGVTSTLGRAAVRAGEGAVVGGGAAGASESIETGKLPSWGSVFHGAALGAVLGGGFGAAEAKLATRKAGKVATELDKLEKLKATDAEAYESQLNRFMEVGNKPPTRTPGTKPQAGWQQTSPQEKVITPPQTDLTPELFTGGTAEAPKFRTGIAPDLPPYPREPLPDPLPGRVGPTPDVTGAGPTPTGFDDIHAADRQLFESQRADAQIHQATSDIPNYEVGTVLSSPDPNLRVGQAELFASRASTPGPDDVIVPRGMGRGPGQGPGGFGRKIPRENAPGGEMEYPRLGIPSPETPTPPGTGGRQATLARIRELEAERAQLEATIAGKPPTNEAPKQDVRPAAVETPPPAAEVAPAAKAAEPPTQAVEAPTPPLESNAGAVKPPVTEPPTLRPAVRIDNELIVAKEGEHAHALMSEVSARMMEGKVPLEAEVRSGWVDKNGKWFDTHEAAQVAEMGFLEKVNAAIGNTGTVGAFTKEQQAKQRLAKAARADLYREISETAVRTGRQIHEAAGDMGIAGPTFRRLMFEHTTDQAVNAFDKAGEQMVRLNERAKMVAPETDVMGSTGNISKELRPNVQSKVWGDNKPHTYDTWISQKSKDRVTNAINEIGTQLTEARRVAASMGDTITSQQFDEATSKFNRLQKELNRQANRYFKERLTAGRIVESYKRPAAVFPEEVMNELRLIGHQVDAARTLREKVPIASNIVESIGAVFKEKSFNALSNPEKIQVGRDVINHARLDLFTAFTSVLDVVTNGTRAGIEIGSGLAGDVAHSVNMRSVSLPNTASMIRSIGIRRPSNNWPGMPKFLDDALAPARQPGEKGFLSRRTSPQLEEKLGHTFNGENIPGNLTLGEMINNPREWREKGIFQQNGNGIFTRRQNQWSAGYDTIAGIPAYSKTTADLGFKRFFGNGLIWREAFTEADKRGLVGADRARFVDDFWAGLPQTVLEDAVTEANKAGWNRQLSHMADRWARNPVVQLMVDPFLRWGFQFGKWGLEMMGRNPTVWRKFQGGTLGPEEATRYFARTLTGWGGVYAIDRIFNQNPDGYVDYHSGEWVDQKSNERQRLSSFEPVISALFLGQIAKGTYAAATGDGDGSQEHFTKALQVMRYSSIPFLKAAFGDGGLLGGPLGTLSSGLMAGKIDTQRLTDEVTSLTNQVLPGQALLSVMKSISDPTLREGLGAKLPGISYLTDERIDMTTGGSIQPTQRIGGGSGPEIPSFTGSPLPGARRILTPIAGALSKYGLMEYRGARLPIAGYRASEAPEGVTREWQKEFGKARNQILSQLLPAIHSAEAKAAPADLKPNAPVYEQIRKTIQHYDTIAAKHATDLINMRHRTSGKMPRQKTVRELTTLSEVE